MRRNRVIQKPGRDTRSPREECEVLNEDCSSQKATSITYIGQFFWVFVYIWPIISFLSQHLLVLGPYPRCMSNFLLRWLVGACPHLWGWGSLPFQPQGAFLHMCAGRSFLDLRSGTSSLYFSKCSALATSFVLGSVLGESRSLTFTPLDKRGCLAQGPSVSYLSLTVFWTPSAFL